MWFPQDFDLFWEFGFSILGLSGSDLWGESDLSVQNSIAEIGVRIQNYFDLSGNSHYPHPD